MSSITRRRRGLISVIGGLPSQGEAPQPWQTKDNTHAATLGHAPSQRVSSIPRESHAFRRLVSHRIELKGESLRKQRAAG